MKKYSKIKTSAGEIITIDTADLASVQKHTWCLKSKDRGAVACVDGQMVDLHRFILGMKIGQSTGAVVKHLNGDKLDCRRENLLLTTMGVALATAKNKQRAIRNKSGFKGVSPIKQNGKVRWRARVSVDKKEISVGHFETPENAAIEYDKAMIKIYGEIAVTNKSMGLIEY